MPLLSRKFLVKIGKIINNRQKLIYHLNNIDGESRLLKNSLLRSQNKLCNGGLKTKDKAEFTRTVKDQLSILKHQREYIIARISDINKKTKHDNQTLQKYSSQLSQIFMVMAERNLPTNEFTKIKKQAEKTLENRRNNKQTWE